MDDKMEMARIGTSATALVVYGMTLNEWVAVATLVYISLQIMVLIPRAISVIRGWLRK